MHTIRIILNLNMEHRDIYHFRGAFLDTVGLREFHEMKGYQLVNYRVYDNKAVIWGLNEGAEAITKLASEKLGNFRFQGEKMPLVIIDKIPEFNVAPAWLPDGILKTYRLHHYIPFAPAKYREYEAAFSMTLKIKIMEDLLINHLVAFCYTAGKEFGLAQNRIAVTLNEIHQRVRAKFKTKDSDQIIVKEPWCYDLDFSTNLQLPNHISLGLHTAYGYGWLHEVNYEL